MLEYGGLGEGGLPVWGWVVEGLLEGEAIFSSGNVAGKSLKNLLFELLLSPVVPDFLSGTVTGSTSGLGRNPNQPNRHAGGRMASSIPESQAG